MILFVQFYLSHFRNQIIPLSQVEIVSNSFCNVKFSQKTLVQIRARPIYIYIMARLEFLNALTKFRTFDFNLYSNDIYTRHWYSTFIIAILEKGVFTYLTFWILSSWLAILQILSPCSSFSVFCLFRLSIISSKVQLLHTLDFLNSLLLLWIIIC